MIVKAEARHVRQSPFKVRRILDLIRGLPVEDAVTTLQFTNRRAAGAVAKVLNSAVANAEHNNALDIDRLQTELLGQRLNQLVIRHQTHVFGNSTDQLTRVLRMLFDQHFQLIISQKSKVGKNLS